jgi:hypothetical protein
VPLSLAIAVFVPADNFSASVTLDDNAQRH